MEQLNDITQMDAFFQAARVYGPLFIILVGVLNLIIWQFIDE